MEQARWNLRKMYPTDELWQADLDRAMVLVDRLAAQEGHAAASAEDLLTTLQLQDELDVAFRHLYVFAHSNFDQNMADPKAKSLMESAQNAYTVMGEKTAFLSPELMQYSMDDFNRYCSEEPALELYRRFATDFYAKKAHILSNDMETLLVRIDRKSVV